LSAAKLQALVIAPPPPFIQLPDSVLKTGLMEIGNPLSGHIGVGYAQEADFSKAGLGRGWEKFFRASDGAVVDAYVFEFATEGGPTSLVALFQSKVPASYEKFALPSPAGAVGYAGTSPEGRSTLAVALNDGRFLFGFTVGGPPGAHDYRMIIESLVTRQLAALP